MKKVMVFLGASIGGTLGGLLGQGLMSSFLLGIVGTGVGMYAAIKIAERYEV